MDWGRKRFVDFNTEKIQLVSFNHSNSCGAINLKMVGSNLTFFKILGLTFSSKLNRISYMILHEVAFYLHITTVRPWVE